MFSSVNIGYFLLMMVALIFAITVHEFAHALAAVRCGDDSPRLQGRISLNPIDHLDPIGTIMMVVSSLAGFGIGWGKPVRINPYNFKNPRWDNLKVSLWGPLSNLCFAAVVGTVLRFEGENIRFILNGSVLLFMGMLVLINIGLALFNLIPVAPLDGSHILASMLPYKMSNSYNSFMARNGMWIFLALIFLGNKILPVLLERPSNFLWRLFIGHPLL